MTAPAGPALVVFDCDGVLVDSEPIALRQLTERLRREGVEITVEETRDRFLGRSVATLRAEIARVFGLDLPTAVFDEMRAELVAIFRRELQPVEGAGALLSGLAAPFCVASSSHPERIEAALRATGLWPLVGGRIFSASMVARGKPAPDLYLLAAKEMGVAPADALAVEDSPAGVEAARRAGMRVVGFTGGGHAGGEAYAARLREAGADVVVDRLSAVAAMLAPAAAGGR